MSAVICDPALHPYLRQHPGDLLRLRPWAELRMDVGECPGCITTLCMPWDDQRRRIEGVPSIAEDEAADREAA